MPLIIQSNDYKVTFISVHRKIMDQLIVFQEEGNCAIVERTLGLGLEEPGLKPAFAISSCIIYFWSVLKQQIFVTSYRFQGQVFGNGFAGFLWLEFFHEVAGELSSEGLTGLDHQLPGCLIHRVVGRRNSFFTGHLTVFTPGSWHPPR